MAKDIISTLPDEILCHILSFLKTEQCFSTTILSKRWKFLCLSVPVLDFSPIILKDPHTNVLFNDFVSFVLLSRDSALPIKSFRLDVEYDDEALQHHNLHVHGLHKWINIVVQRSVEHLDLRVDDIDWAKFPITIFSCRTLVSLELSTFRAEDSFSSAIVLPLLKILHLKLIILQTYQDFMLLLAGCPILQELLVSDISFESEESLSSKWKNFSLSKLTEANVDFSYFHFHFHFPLEALNNVQSLRIDVELHKGHSIPTFHNLTQLHLYSLNCRWHLFAEVLKHCPMLQELKLAEIGGMDIGEESWVDPDYVPQCLSLHLRTCDLFGLLSQQGELRVARYILKNAIVLQTMTVWDNEHPEVESILSSFPTASSTCQLTFNHGPCK